MSKWRSWTETLLSKPLYAAMFAGACMFLPFVQWVGWGWISLSTLRNGLTYGLYTVLGAVAAILILVGGISGSWWMALGQIVALVIPIWIFSLVLRNTVSLSLTLQAIAISVLAVFLVTHFLDLINTEALTARLEQLFTQDAPVDESTQYNVQSFSEQFVASWPAALFWVYIAGVFLGRAAQAALDNPGGFSKEFKELRLNYWVGSISFVFIIVGFWLPITVLLLAVTGIVTSLLVVAGLGLVHYYVSFRKWSGWVFVAVYASLFLLTMVMLPLLIVLAAADSVFNIRKRLTKSEA